MATPTSSDGFAVRKVGKGTWSVQRKAVPGFTLGVRPAPQRSRATRATRKPA